MTDTELWADLSVEEAEMVMKAVKSCPTCWGRGHVGWRVSGKMATCKCVRKVYTKLLLARINKSKESPDVHSQETSEVVDQSVLQVPPVPTAPALSGGSDRTIAPAKSVPLLSPIVSDRPLLSKQ